ncbi:membrane-fusion protein [Lachnospiraceae bacterium JC7]|nr:membrane-fusion protein [Lachnospiraceae bacterium JC7]
MKKRILIFILLILVGLTAFYGYHYVKLEVLAPSAGNATSSELERKKEVSKISFNGSVEVMDSFTVESMVSGSVFQLYVNKGKKVSKGDNILLIDNRKEVEEAKKVWEETILVVSEARVKAAAAVSEMNRITPDFDEGRINAQTYKVTVDRATLANEELETAIMASEDARSRYENAYSNALVKAPEDGRIGEIDLKRDQEIASGDSLFELKETAVKYIKFKVDEDVVSELYPGKTLTFLIRDVKFFGKVISIQPDGTDAKSFTVKAVPKDNVNLPEGMGVNVRIGEVEEDTEEYGERLEAVEETTAGESDVSNAAGKPDTTNPAVAGKTP